MIGRRRLFHGNVVSFPKSAGETMDEGSWYRDSIPATDLEYWASLGNLPRVRAVLESNPDMNIKGVGGYTAVHAAAENGHLAMLRLLIERGADLSPRLDSGQTPLDLATQAGQKPTADLLRSLGAR